MWCLSSGDDSYANVAFEITRLNTVLYILEKTWLQEPRWEMVRQMKSHLKLITKLENVKKTKISDSVRQEEYCQKCATMIVKILTGIGCPRRDRHVMAVVFDEHPASPPESDRSSGLLLSHCGLMPAIFLLA